MSKLSPAEIYQAAFQAGADAVAGGVDGYPCGFAWVTIHPSNCAFAKWIKANGKGRSGYPGYKVRGIECHGWFGQNMYVQESGVRAFAEVLRANGIKCSIETRID